MKQFASQSSGVVLFIALAAVISFLPNAALAQQCNWYGQTYSLCSTTRSGWGYENQKSCISAATCKSQPAPYGVMGSNKSSGDALTVFNGHCNWYGSRYPLCDHLTGGWGWEKSASCIGVSTCQSQPSPYGVEASSASSSSSSSSASSSSSGHTSAHPPTLCGVGVSTRTDLPAGWRFGLLTEGVSRPFMTVFPDPSAEASELPDGYYIQCVTTSDGERIGQIVPPSIPPRIVNVGGECGGFDANGAQQICITGTQCLKAKDSPKPSCVLQDGRSPINNG